MLISGTPWALPIRANRVTNTDTHMNINVFLRCMTEMHLLSCLEIENLFLSTSDKFKCPPSLFHTRKNGGSVNTDECGIFMQYDFQTIFYSNDYYLLSFKKKISCHQNEKKKNSPKKKRKCVGDFSIVKKGPLVLLLIFNQK